jgi:tRNA/tmRNA/rRNA uracil-C5-methylase (TrmA/RlmC/RlmD family)
VAGGRVQLRHLHDPVTNAGLTQLTCCARTGSNDPNVRARDGAYRVAEVTPVDQFCYSAHVEIVAKLMR